MKILSFDIGIKNLSYVSIDINSTENFIINNWENINITHDYNNLIYISSVYSQASLSELQKICDFHKIPPTPNETQQTQQTQQTKTKIINKTKIKKLRKSDYIKLIRDFLHIHKIKKRIYNPTIEEYGKLLIKKLDIISSKVSLEELDYIIVEDQPRFNNKMKILQVMIITYFLIKSNESDKKPIVKSVSPKLKSKLCELYFEKENLNLELYKERKKTSIELVKKLVPSHILSDFESWTGKKDDLSDVILQALSYQKFKF